MLRGLWRRLERGESVGRGEVEAAIRMADQDTDPRLPLSDLPAIRTRRGAVGPRSPGQAAYMEALAGHEMVFGVGPAGTGKTYLAVAQGVAMLQAGKVDRIVLSRPAVEAGERLGFLPGDMKEKVDPYLRPLYDALHDMLPGEQVMRRLANGEIEVAPLAFMRGRTLAHAFVILDEAQNTTPVQMKMFLTRMGEGTRMVVTGDLPRSTCRAARGPAWRRARYAGGRAGHRRRALRQARRGAPSAGGAHRRGLRAAARSREGDARRRSATRTAVAKHGRIDWERESPPQERSDPEPRDWPRASGPIAITVAEPAWRRLLPRAEAIARRAARIAATDVTGGGVIGGAGVRPRRPPAERRASRPQQADQRADLRPAGAGPAWRDRAGARHRPPRGRRRRSGRPAHHLAHLVVHGALHLAGHDHHHAGDARRMEMAEARILQPAARAQPVAARMSGGHGRAGLRGAAARSAGAGAARTERAREDRRTGAGSRRRGARSPARRRNWTATSAR